MFCFWPGVLSLRKGCLEGAGLKEAASFNHEGGKIGFETTVAAHDFLFAGAQQIRSAQPGGQTLQNAFDMLEFP